MVLSAIKEEGKKVSGKSCPQELLKEWFFSHRRELPWREEVSPYAIWVSEVMLQQTQVNVVIPYFKRWLALFPTISALAKAPLEQVIKAWEGLGYYSRARNLHAGAQFLCDHHGGNLPENPTILKKIKGLGPYTIGALLSFAFKKKAAAVDGNVSRVLSRYFCLEEEIDSLKTKKYLEAKTLHFLPDKEPWIVMEALIELGALICQKAPLCTKCPLEKSCLAKKAGKELFLPRKKKREKITEIYRLVGIIERGDKVLLKQGEKGKVMEGLFEFPYVEVEENVFSNEGAISHIEKAFSIQVAYKSRLKKVKHGFTRYRALLYPYLLEAKTDITPPNMEWISKDRLFSLPFSSGHRQLIAELSIKNYQGHTLTT